LQTKTRVQRVAAGWSEGGTWNIATATNLCELPERPEKTLDIATIF